MFTLGEIIDLAIRIENNGESTYRKAQYEVSSPELASMLQGSADDEAEHEKWFAKFREDMDAEIEDPKLEVMGRSILQSVLGDNAFSMNEADFSRIDNTRNLLELSLESEKDLANIFLLRHKELEGSVNCTAPYPVSNKEVTKILGDVLQKPAFLPPVPVFLLKIIQGEFATVLVKGQKVIPKKSADSNYQFEFPALKEALEDILK